MLHPGIILLNKSLLLFLEVDFLIADNLWGRDEKWVSLYILFIYCFRWCLFIDLAAIFVSLALFVPFLSNLIIFLQLFICLFHFLVLILLYIKQVSLWKGVCTICIFLLYNLLLLLRFLIILKQLCRKLKFLSYQVPQRKHLKWVFLLSEHHDLRLVFSFFFTILHLLFLTLLLLLSSSRFGCLKLFLHLLLLLHCPTELLFWHFAIGKLETRLLFSVLSSTESMSLLLESGFVFPANLVARARRLITWHYMAFFICHYPTLRTNLASWHKIVCPAFYLLVFECDKPWFIPLFHLNNCKFIFCTSWILLITAFLVMLSICRDLYFDERKDLLLSYWVVKHLFVGILIFGSSVFLLYLWIKFLNIDDKNGQITSNSLCNC